jgi:mersacidin/lichenicidin family type 2 lantibiotic
MTSMTETIDPKARKVIARAWKDEEYRNGLPSEVREKLPPPPEGASRMSDEELEAAAGGTTIACAGLAVGAIALGVSAEEAWDD